MKLINNEKNKTVGTWKAIKHVGNGAWLCCCIKCNRESILTGHAFRLGKGRCRTCFNRYLHLSGQSNSLPKGESAFNFLYNNYRCKSKRQNKEFKLSKKFFKRMTKECCYYCGIGPLQEITMESLRGSYIYNGIDKVDSSKGYTEDNVVPCCKRCNKAKAQDSQEDFMGWLKFVVTNNITKFAKAQEAAS